MQVYLSVTPADCRTAMQYHRRLAHVAYRIGLESRLLRQNLLMQTKGGLMSLSDRDAPPIARPEVLCREIWQECAARSYAGVLADFEAAPTQDRLSFLDRLCTLLHRNKRRLYLPEVYARQVNGAVAIICTALSGGSFCQRLQEAAEGCVKLVTVAPEQPGSTEFIQAAKELGVHVSVGHTVANYETAKAAFEAGADHATHLYNAMPPLAHRDPGVIGAAYEVPTVKPELICDGIHIHPSVVRLTFGLFGKERMIIVSDSLRATGMPDGEYPFGGQMIEVHGNRATILHHPETLAGSVTSLMGCLRQAIAFGIPAADAVRACTFNPAQSIGIEHRAGTLDVGKEASIVLLDQKDLSIRKIIFKGEAVTA